MNKMLKMKMFFVAVGVGCLLSSPLIGMAAALPVVADAFADIQRKAEQGDAEAQFELAECHRLGISTNKDANQAQTWYEKAAAQNYPRALFFLAKQIKKTNPVQAQQYYQRGSDGDGEPLCLYALACMLAPNGTAADRSAEQERKLLAQVVSNTYIARKGILNKEYIRELTKCHSRAAHKLGIMHENGMGGLAPSYHQAAMCYRKSLASDPKYDKALYCLASLHLRGDGVDRDLPEASRLLRLCPDTFAPAQCLLGNMARDAKRFPEAVDYYRNVQYLSGEAAYNLGLLCESGNGTAVDQENALALFQLAALKGYQDAINKLAPLTKANAATKENAAVQCLFGKLCRDGIGMPRNLRDALTWFTKAIKNKSADAEKELKILAGNFAAAQLFLAAAYETGDNVKQDKAEAVVWYIRAALLNEVQALESLKRLAADNLLSAILALASFHEKGQAQCALSEALAVEWYKKASVMNSPESALKVADYLMREGKENEAIEWFKKAVQMRSVEALDRLKALAEKNPVASYTLGEIYLEERGVAKDTVKAREYFARGSAMNYGRASFTLASLLENDTILILASPEDVMVRYQRVLELFEKAAKDGYEDAIEEAARVKYIIEGLLALPKPDFKNFLFLKLRQEIPNTCSAELLMYSAVIAEKARMRFSDIIQEFVFSALKNIAQFGTKGQFARATIKLLLHLVESNEFTADQLAPTAENKRVNALFRICRGIHLLKMDSKDFERRQVYRRAEDAVQDVRIDVFNSIFRQDQAGADDQAYQRAVTTLIELFRTHSREGRISDDMKRDNDWPDILGTESRLLNLLTYHKTDRWKNRIIKIARMITTKLDPSMQAQLLGSWSAAGHHCETRAENETYKFYVANLTDKSSLDKENLGLEMRAALFLAEFRKKCISDLVPANLRERDHNICYLEKKVGRALSLVGDAEDFNDNYVNATVQNIFKQMTKEQILEAVLKKYTVDSMARCIAQEANKPPQDSRLPFHSIFKYFETLFGGDAAQQLGLLYNDDSTQMTEIGAKILLHHFGYLE